MSRGDRGVEGDMYAQKVIEVPLPEGVTPSEDEESILRAVFQAILCLRCESGRKWKGIEQTLDREGWATRCTLEWHVRARRGDDWEEATGKTRDEAFASLYQQTLLDRAQV